MARWRTSRRSCSTSRARHTLRRSTRRCCSRPMTATATFPTAPSRCRPSTSPRPSTSRCDADGNLKAMELDFTMLQSKTLEAQAEASKESLCEMAALLRDVGITEAMEPRILSFALAFTMNNRATAAHKAARVVRRDDEAINDPTCVHHAITNIFKEGRKAMNAVVRETMNITDEMATITDAQKVKAMRTSVGLFSLPWCALIYQCTQ
eukprot:1227834-Pleurochrysis_carterae.AAC.1